MSQPPEYPPHPGDREPTRPPWSGGEGSPTVPLPASGAGPADPGDQAGPTEPIPASGAGYPPPGPMYPPGPTSPGPMSPAGPASPPGYPPANPNPAPTRPYPAVPPPGQPYQQYPHAAYPGQPVAGGPPPGQPYPPQYGLPVPPAPVKKRRTLLIVSIVLAVVVVLCGGGATGAYFLLNNVGDKGQAVPEDAVRGFLKAVFVDHDVDAATSYVCTQSRNKASLRKKIDELRSYDQRYKSPQYSWTESAAQRQGSDRATVTVTLRMSTSDDRAAERKLRFLTVKRSGWWVCEISGAGS